ncbi:MAG TPA: hypothetical protein VHE30_18350 [Polyangiaceae bacterium]|nr:hypothetical protein [Polyangiaceae bacterium]
MNEQNEAEREAPDSEPEELEDSVKNLLKGALGGAPAPETDVLGGVQRKLRDRSGGKFYADEWSTSKSSPTLTFLVTSALMLVIVLVTYAVLAPLRGKPERVGTEPVPVEVLPPVHR